MAIRVERSRCVDAQLDSLEEDLRVALEYQLLAHTAYAYWNAHDRPHTDDLMNLAHVIDDAFVEIMNRWRPVTVVFELLDKFRILVQNCSWVAVNVPWPGDGARHYEKVIDNIFEMYVRQVYPYLRTEMIMASHHLEVIQRNWRRCNTDANHPACRRRLLREFNELKHDEGETPNGSCSAQAGSGRAPDSFPECCTPTR